MLRQRTNGRLRANGDDPSRAAQPDRATAFVVLVIVSPAILFFLWMISLSLKYEIDNGAYPPIFIPERFAWSNYAKVFAENNFLLYFWNSVLVTGTATLLALLIGVPAGYGIARLKADKVRDRHHDRPHDARPFLPDPALPAVPDGWAFSARSGRRSSSISSSPCRSSSGS